MSEVDKILLLRNCTLWSEISEEEFEQLNLIHNFIEANKGAYIYFEAFNHNKLYFLKEGHIKIGYINEEGKEITKDIIGQGDIFGQVTLEKDNLNGEFAQAYKADVSLCAFTIDDFQKLLQKRPELALRYSKQVGTKLRHIESRLVNLLNKDVKTRLLNFLWQLSQHNMLQNMPDGICIPNYLTHEDIANLIGSSRQTVTTMINELNNEQVISYDRHKICFLDVKKLQKLVGVA
jgi:CRP/FNR family transcriptional regulator, cyclic AMP receptor protein